MMNTRNKSGALEPIYAIFKNFDEELDKQPNETRLLLAIISLAVNILLPITFLIGHKHKAAVLSTIVVLINIALIVFKAVFAAFAINLLANIILVLTGLTALILWGYGLYILLTVVVPDFRERNVEDPYFKGDKINYDK